MIFYLLGLPQGPRGRGHFFLCCTPNSCDELNHQILSSGLGDSITVGRTEFFLAPKHTQVSPLGHDLGQRMKIPSPSFVTTHTINGIKSLKLTEVIEIK